MNLVRVNNVEKIQIQYIYITCLIEALADCVLPIYNSKSYKGLLKKAIRVVTKAACSTVSFINANDIDGITHNSMKQYKKIFVEAVVIITDDYNYEERLNFICDILIGFANKSNSESRKLTVDAIYAAKALKNALKMYKPRVIPSEVVVDDLFKKVDTQDLQIGKG